MQFVHNYEDISLSFRFIQIHNHLNARELWKLALYDPNTKSYVLFYVLCSVTVSLRYAETDNLALFGDNLMLPLY